MTPEDRLRAVLRAHADRIEPAPGLEQIRAGIAARATNQTGAGEPDGWKGAEGHDQGTETPDGPRGR